MNYERMGEIQEDLFGRIREIRSTKGREYASEEDTLADFKEVAVEAGVTPYQVWATYVKKHERAIDTFIREGAVKSESIEGRILDVIVYHLLLLGLIEDEHATVESPARVATVTAVVDPRPEEGPNPYDILHRYMQSQVSTTTLAAINAELRERGFLGTAVLNGNQLSYIEPKEPAQPIVEQDPDDALAEAREALEKATAVWEAQ